MRKLLHRLASRLPLLKKHMAYHNSLIARAEQLAARIDELIDYANVNKLNYSIPENYVSESTVMGIDETSAPERKSLIRRLLSWFVHHLPYMKKHMLKHRLLKAKVKRLEKQKNEIELAIDTEVERCLVKAGFDFKREPGRFLMDRAEPVFEHPLLSLVTPYYNAGKYFEQTYNCVLNQTFPWFEWIIVDDGSTDEKAVKLLDELAAKDKRIKVLKQKNAGAVKARKLGISKSKSDIIIFLDADDITEKRWLECMYWALARNPDAAWAYSDSVGFHGQEYVWKKKFSSVEERNCNLLPYAAAIRKIIFEQHPDIYADDTRNNLEDWQLWLKILALRHIPAHITGLHFWYRRLESGELSRVYKDDKLLESLHKHITELAEAVPDNLNAIEINGRNTSDYAKMELFSFKYDTYKVNDGKTQILVLFPHVVTGGADWFNLQIAKHINKEKYSLNIICTGFIESDGWLQELDEYCDDLYVLKEFLPMHDWPGFIYYYIKTRNVEVVWNISSYYGYYLFPWLRMHFPGLALGTYVHADAPYWKNGGYARAAAAFHEVIDLTVATNRATLGIMHDNYGLPEGNTDVSYIGTDVDYYNLDNISRGSIRTAYNIPENVPVILFLCRLCPEKRPFLMLEIAEKLAALLPNVRFLVVGKGNRMDESKLLAKKLNLDSNVIFCGMVEDTRPYYRDSDILLICSLKEGLAQTTYEAMAMGLPVVSSDVGGQREIVNDETGALVKCRQNEADVESVVYDTTEVNEFTNALYKYASDLGLCSSVGRTNKEMIRKSYSTVNAARDIERFSTALITDDRQNKRRKKVSECMSSFPALVDEAVKAYASMEKLQLEANDIWKALTERG